MHMGLDALERFTQAVNRLFALGAGILVLVIVLVMVREVFFRYVLNAPSLWAMDGSSFALVFVFFLALAPALESGHHVHVDLFDPLVPPRLRPHLHLLGYGLTVTFAAVLLWYVLDATREAFRSNELTYSVIPVPLKYVYWIGPVGTLELLLTAMVQFGRAWCAQANPATDMPPGR